MLIIKRAFFPDTGGYFEFARQRCPGGDLEELDSVTSASECKAMCDMAPTCVAVTMHSTT